MVEATIRDAVLRKALQRLSSGLLAAELSRKKTLECPRSSERGMRSLEGLEVCKGLAHLDLSNQELVDLGPLACLTKLKKLYLQGNKKLEDISPLATLGKLEVLYLSGTAVREIAVLGNLGALRVLSVSETRVQDIMPLRGLEALTNLVLRDCPDLVIEDGDANHATIDRLLGRGVDVYIRNSHVDALKARRGIAPS